MGPPRPPDSRPVNVGETPWAVVAGLLAALALGVALIVRAIRSGR